MRVSSDNGTADVAEFGGPRLLRTGRSQAAAPEPQGWLAGMLRSETGDGDGPEGHAQLRRHRVAAPQGDEARS